MTISKALLTVLLLRGPQTPGELRQRTERMHLFADTAAVETELDELPPRRRPLKFFKNNSTEIKL